MNKSENMTKTVGEFFLILFIPFCKIADGLISLLTLGIFFTSLTLWSAKQLARYRMKRMYP